ncbi:MAG: aminotransferase class V-fold PLP-dependent enzyme [Lentisphaerae bacterium]|nr:aminotransferase class V-fold PLP-dependent enzyme [Lentisphaerota bacterium]
MLPYFSEEFGNPSSLHMYGQRARIAIDTAREKVAASLGCASHEIIFTSGGTESDNLAIYGYIGKSAESGKQKLHVITSAIEHNAVLKACQHLEERGVEVTYLPVSGEGIVDVEALRSSIRKNTVLVSIMAANNEIGTIQPLGDIVQISHEKGVPVHADAVQAFGKIPLNVKELGIDMLSISGHKFYGPKGSGALYLRRGVRLEAFVRGGTQERGMRGGTENIPAVVGLGKACETAKSGLQENFLRERMLRDRLQMSILKNIENVRINGDFEKRVPNTLSIGFLGIEAEALAVRLDIAGISVSTGSACSSGASQVSHVLKALRVSAEFLGSAIRFSIGRKNTPEQIDHAASITAEIVADMRKKAF